MPASSAFPPLPSTGCCSCLGTRPSRRSSVSASHAEPVEASDGVGRGHLVMPAHAGTQSRRLKACRKRLSARRLWIPAFAVRVRGDDTVGQNHGCFELTAAKSPSLNGASLFPT